MLAKIKKILSFSLYFWPEFFIVFLWLLYYFFQENYLVVAFGDRGMEFIGDFFYLSEKKILPKPPKICLKTSKNTG